MNKKIIGTVVIATALFAGYNMYESSAEMKLSDLALANIEALAGCEDDVRRSQPGRSVFMTCPQADGGSYTLEACDFDKNYPKICTGRPAGSK